jgi:hypothetical protein
MTRPAGPFGVCTCTAVNSPRRIRRRTVSELTPSCVAASAIVRPASRWASCTGVLSRVARERLACCTGWRYSLDNSPRRHAASRSIDARGASLARTLAGPPLAARRRSPRRPGRVRRRGTGKVIAFTETRLDGEALGALEARERTHPAIRSCTRRSRHGGSGGQ